MRPLVESLQGTLLGTAIGDALGLPAEGLPPRVIGRRFGALERYSLLGRVGVVSDDTEQSFLVLQSLIGAHDDAEIVRRFRRSLVGWFWRLPFGVGLATLRACLRATLGFTRTGVDSAGNGAAMRAPILGVALRERPLHQIAALATALAQVTHVEQRAVDGAVLSSMIACALSRGDGVGQALHAGLTGVRSPELRDAVNTASALGSGRTPPDECARVLGTTGFVMHSVPWAIYCLVRHADEPMSAVRMAINGGGDTDTNAAIVGAWLGARHGVAAWPRPLVEALAGGPFGVSHGRRLCVAAVRGAGAPAYIWPLAMARNLALFPVVLAHGLRRLWPFG